MKLERKKEIIEDLQGRFQKSNIVIITDYKGLNVETLNSLRKKLREASIEYKVVKNTLLKRAAKDIDVALISDMFKGPTAVALGSGDPVVPAKLVTKFAEEQELFKVRAALLKSGKRARVLEAKDVKALASLPSREVLLASLLAAMNGVPTGFVRALSDIPRRLLNVLRAVQEQKEKKEAA